MKTWTYGEVRALVEKELDLEEENFIQPSEMAQYCNEAIDECEAEIHTLGLEDGYFLSSEPLAMVQGQQAYSMPSDIYANKIISIIHDDGSKKYPIKRVRGVNKFEKLAYVDASDDYSYIIRNSSSAGVKIMLYPPAKTTDSSIVTIWYIRNLATVAEDVDVVEVPEFINFVRAYMKAKCMAKENMGEVPPGAAAELEQQRRQMNQTLMNMVPDGDNEIEVDQEFYQNHE